MWRRSVLSGMAAHRHVRYPHTGLIRPVQRVHGAVHAHRSNREFASSRDSNPYATPSLGSHRPASFVMPMPALSTAESDAILRRPTASQPNNTSNNQTQDWFDQRPTSKQQEQNAFMALLDKKPFTFAPSTPVDGATTASTMTGAGSTTPTIDSNESLLFPPPRAAAFTRSFSDRLTFLLLDGSSLAFAIAGSTPFMAQMPIGLLSSWDPLTATIAIETAQWGFIWLSYAGMVSITRNAFPSTMTLPPPSDKGSEGARSIFGSIWRIVIAFAIGAAVCWAVPRVKSIDSMPTQRRIEYDLDFWNLSQPFQLMPLVSSGIQELLLRGLVFVRLYRSLNSLLPSYLLAGIASSFAHAEVTHTYPSFGVDSSSFLSIFLYRLARTLTPSILTNFILDEMPTLSAYTNNPIRTLESLIRLQSINQVLATSTNAKREKEATQSIVKRMATVTRTSTEAKKISEEINQRSDKNEKNIVINIELGKSTADRIQSIPHCLTADGQLQPWIRTLLGDVFRRLDRDGRGYLTPAEFASLSSLHPRAIAEFDAVTNIVARRIGPEQQEKMTQTQIQALQSNQTNAPNSQIKTRDMTEWLDAIHAGSMGSFSSRSHSPLTPLPIEIASILPHLERGRVDPRAGSRTGSYRGLAVEYFDVDPEEILPLHVRLALHHPKRDELLSTSLERALVQRWFAVRRTFEYERWFHATQLEHTSRAFLRSTTPLSVKEMSFTLDGCNSKRLQETMLQHMLLQPTATAMWIAKIHAVHSGAEAHPIDEIWRKKTTNSSPSA